MSKREELSKFLADNGIAVETFHHPPLFTCEDVKLAPPMPGAMTKNLFLKPKTSVNSAESYLLLTVPDHKRVDLKALGEILGTPKLSLAPPETLLELLSLTPGSVSLFGLKFDTNHRVTSVIDSEIWASSLIQCHPLENTSTSVISKSDLVKFLGLTGHTPKIINVPARLPA